MKNLPLVTPGSAAASSRAVPLRARFSACFFSSFFFEQVLGRRKNTSFPLGELSGLQWSGTRRRDSLQAVFASQRSQLLMATGGKDTFEEKAEKHSDLVRMSQFYRLVSVLLQPTGPDLVFFLVCFFFFLQHGSSK